MIQSLRWWPNEESKRFQIIAIIWPVVWHHWKFLTYVKIILEDIPCKSYFFFERSFPWTITKIYSFWVVSVASNTYVVKYIMNNFFHISWLFFLAK